MKLNCNSFFDGDFQYINLNELYLKNKHKIPDTKDPQQIQWELNLLYKNTYGGYGEDRKDIWKGTYMDERKNYIHLGIDITVPQGTEIKCPFDCYVENYFKDIDTKIGWGGRIIIKQSNLLPSLVLGHIDPNSLNEKKLEFKKGEIVGKVGTWPDNGNTFEHLHIQAINRGHVNINDFDGYGYYSDLIYNPNPFEVEFL